MKISNIWLNLSLLAGFLMAAVSAAGIFTPGVYALEHPSWAAQGYGQDIINLALVFPALLFCVALIRKGSEKTILVWLGILVYIAYSYVLYAFFMHFNPWFLIYISILGLSFYTLMGSIIALSHSPSYGMENKTKGASIYLLINGTIFGILWLLEIIPSLIDGKTPKSATDVGLWINPVHVLDLGLLLPAMIIAGVSLWKKKPIGQILAVPMITFAIIMATAIISMIIVMNMRGVSDSMGPAPIMGLNVLIGAYIIYNLLKNYELHQQKA